MLGNANREKTRLLSSEERDNIVVEPDFTRGQRARVVSVFPISGPWDRGFLFDEFMSFPEGALQGLFGHELAHQVATTNMTPGGIAGKISKAMKVVRERMMQADGDERRLLIRSGTKKEVEIDILAAELGGKQFIEEFLSLYAGVAERLQSSPSESSPEPFLYGSSLTPRAIALIFQFRSYCVSQFCT
ncbi:hypothetical protein ACFL31_01235 [Candidatus Margulisiibacteriota bacterium]